MYQRVSPFGENIGNCNQQKFSIDTCFSNKYSALLSNVFMHYNVLEFYMKFRYNCSNQKINATRRKNLHFIMKKIQTRK